MAYKYNIKINQGETFTMRLRLSDASVDLTGATGRGKIRALFTDAAATADFTVTVGSDSEGDYILCVLSAAVTAAIPLTVTGPVRKTQRFVYDIEAVLADTTTVIRVVEGYAEVSPEATK